MKVHKVFLIVFISFLISLPTTTLEAKVVERPQTRDSYEDLKYSFKLLLNGGLEQFKQENNLYYLALATPALWYSFEHDDRLSDLALSKDIPKHIDIAGDLGVVFNFPIVPIGLYYYGRHNNDDKLVQFSFEYISTLYLALGESGILSYIPIHNRPVTTDTSFWEEAFRDDSSFPSGHVIPFMALFYKTFQFYGPLYSLPPLVLSVWSSMQRSRDGKHFTSDLVGSFFLTAFASEGVRAAAGYDNNHPIYKKYFEGHNVQMGLFRYKNTLAPMVSFTY